MQNPADVRHDKSVKRIGNFTDTQKLVYATLIDPRNLQALSEHGIIDPAKWVSDASSAQLTTILMFDDLNQALKQVKAASNSPKSPKARLTLLAPGAGHAEPHSPVHKHTENATQRGGHHGHRGGIKI